MAGLLAGLSMYFFRSTSLSLYVAGKAVEVSGHVTLHKNATVS